MSKSYKFGIVATLALGLCLAAGHAHAIMEAFKGTNDTGETLNIGCSSSSYSEISNGSSTSLVCNDSIYMELTSGSPTTSYTVTYSCGTSEIQEVTATTGTSAGTLDLDKSCAGM